jgi:DNA polymerase III sliding clamp (beta) subunit (PCNA family)|tara:strand:- start:147 stop:371 length:225 start_codon:yes stop_codon:yes gene_type:complete
VDLRENNSMTPILKQKIIQVCNTKIEQKGTNVGLSFYSFIANKNNNPALLMETATWWIKTHKLYHFYKALKLNK